MGYTTDFDGYFDLSPALSPEQVAYINKLGLTRRMKRDEAKASLMPDPIREAVGLPLGKDAEYFTGGGGFAGQDKDDSIIDYNRPGGSQPGLWLQWEVNPAGDTLAWDGQEKFYDYVKWLEYLIEHFFRPWGIEVNGEVEWRGEEWEDTGVIKAGGHVVEVTYG